MTTGGYLLILFVMAVTFPIMFWLCDQCNRLRRERDELRAAFDRLRRADTDQRTKYADLLANPPHRPATPPFAS